MRVPFYDFAAEYQSIHEEIDEAISRVLRSGSYAHGKEIDSFEEEFAAYCGIKHAVTTGSCYDAMFRGLIALGVGKGDEVITVSNTDIACTVAIRRTGASIVWVDIDPRTYNINPTEIESKIRAQTKAILVVHMYGHPADMNSILEIADRHNLYVIEDAAMAVGSLYKGRRVGTFGDIGCFSHGLSKILNNYGDGGTLVTDDGLIANRVRRLFIYSESEAGPRIEVGNEKIHAGFNFTVEGYQGRMVEMGAAILRVKLKKLDSWITARREIARRYDELLSELDVDLPYESKDVKHIYRNYTVHTDARDEVRVKLAENGVGTGLHYSPPLHLQEVYKDLGYRRGSLPVTEYSAERLFTLPIYPQLTDDQIQWVANAMIRAY